MLDTTARPVELSDDASASPSAPSTTASFYLSLPWAACSFGLARGGPRMTACGSSIWCGIRCREKAATADSDSGAPCFQRPDGGRGRAHGAGRHPTRAVDRSIRRGPVGAEHAQGSGRSAHRGNALPSARRPIFQGDGCCTGRRLPALVLEFLAQITQGDLELVAFFQKFIGYTLTGVTAEHAFTFLWGPGGNGKSVLLKTQSWRSWAAMPPPPWPMCSR